MKVGVNLVYSVSLTRLLVYSREVRNGSWEHSVLI